MLRDVHGAGFIAALNAGVQGVMASFSSWEGQKMHGRHDALTGILKKRWQFDGVVVGDWNGHGQLPGCSPENAPDALRAGLDLYMAPDSWKGLYHSLLSTIERGRDQLSAAGRSGQTHFAS